jgi:hypothetical protein
LTYNGGGLIEWPSGKKPLTYNGKSTKPGGGGLFAMMHDALMAKGMSDERASSITAAAGRKKFGAKRFAHMAAIGRRRAER